MLHLEFSYHRLAVANDEFEEEKRKLEAKLKALHEELKAGKE